MPSHTAHHPKPLPAERRAYTINEFCEAYRICRATAYKLMKKGKLRYLNVAGDRRIPVEAADALIHADETH